MKKKHFLLGGLACVAFGVFAASGAGCSSDSGGAGGSGEGASTATSTSTSPQTSSTTLPMTSTTTTGPTTTTTTTGAGGGSTAGHMFSDATPITVGATMATPGVLPDPSTSTDFYTFMGTAGEHIGISTTAKTGTDPFDTSYLDLVVTVYDSTQTQIAQQDDPWPRISNDPQLFIELPSAGQYYVEVEECNAAFSMGCATDPITHKDYTLQVYDFGASAGNPVTDEQAETAAAHTDDTSATSTNALVYVEDTMIMPPEYEFSFVDGTYIDASDVDVYSFTPKSDSVVGGTRANAEFWLQTSGTAGNGSTTPMGLTWVVDGTSMNVIAQLDGTNYGNVDDATNSPAELAAIVTIGSPYFLFVQHPGTAAGSNDFYIFQHLVEGINPVEAETANMLMNSNDTLATAEGLAMVANTDGSNSYFIEGDLPAGDAHDIFKVTTVTGFTTVTASCAAQRIGSGMQGMTYKLLGGATGTTVVGTITENATMDQYIGSGPTPPSIPAGTTTLYLQIDPGTQDTTNTSNFYRCGISLQP